MLSPNYLSGGLNFTPSSAPLAKPQPDAGIEDLLRLLAQQENAAYSQPEIPAPTGYGRPGSELAAGGIAILANLLDKRGQAGTAGYQAYRGALGQRQAADYQTQAQGQKRAQQQGLLLAGQTERQIEEARRTQGLARDDARYAENRAYQRDQAARQQTERDRVFNEGVSSRLRDDYRQAKSAGEMRRIAGQMRNVFGMVPPTEEEIQGEWKQRQATAINTASRDFAGEARGYLNAFGEVPESVAMDLMAKRARIAQQYGVDPEQIGAIPTGRTIRAKAEDERKREFDQKLGFLVKQQRDNLAVKKANLEIAKGRLATYQQSVANGMWLGASNLDMRRYEAEASARAKDYNGTVDKEIAKLNQQIAGAAAAAQAATGQKKKDADAKLAGLQSQKEYLEGTKEPYIELGGAAGAIMGPVPNPAYQQPGGSAPQLPGMRPLNPLQGTISPVPGQSKVSKPAKKSGPAKLPPGWSVRGG